MVPKAAFLLLGCLAVYFCVPGNFKSYRCANAWEQVLSIQQKGNEYVVGVLTSCPEESREKIFLIARERISSVFGAFQKTIHKYHFNHQLFLSSYEAERYLSGARPLSDEIMSEEAWKHFRQIVPILWQAYYALVRNSCRE